MFCIDALRFYKPVCLFLLLHVGICAISCQLVCSCLTLDFNNPPPELLILAFWQTYLTHAHTNTHTNTHAHTRCMNLGMVWISSFIANSSPVLIKTLPQPRNFLLWKQRSCYGFKWSAITSNFTAYLKSICFSITLLELGKTSNVLYELQVDKIDIKQTHSFDVCICTLLVSPHLLLLEIRKHS